MSCIDDQKMQSMYEQPMPGEKEAKGSNSALSDGVIKPCRWCGEKPEEYKQGSERIGFTKMVTCKNNECCVWGMPVDRKTWQEAEAF